MTRVSPASAALLLASLCAQTAPAQDAIVHDAEYYVLEAQNGEKWRAEDQQLRARLAALRGNERALPVLLQWLDDTEWVTVPPEGTSVHQAAYQAALAILTRTAPEPPTGFEEPPRPVSGPWDED